MSTRAWAAAITLCFAATFEAAAQAPTPPRTLLSPSVGFGWSTESPVGDSALHFRVGARFDYRFTDSIFVSAALKDQLYRRDYLTDRFSLEDPGYARVRLGEQKLDADAQVFYELARGSRGSLAAGVGPSFRFFMNEALPSQTGPIAAAMRAGVVLAPGLDLTAGASYAYNLLANPALPSALGGPRGVTSYHGLLGLQFPPAVAFRLGYEGEAVALDNSVRLFHSVVFMLDMTFDAQPEVVVAAAAAKVEEQPLVLSQPAFPTTGRVRGSVLDAASKKPLPDAVVTLPGRNRLLAGSGGEFEATEVPPGRLVVKAELPGYSPGEAAGTVTAGQETRLVLALRPSPRPPPPPAPVADERPATLRGTIVSETDRLLSAMLTVPTAKLGPMTVVKGAYEVQVPPGEHGLEVSATGYLSEGRRVAVDPGATVVQDFVLKSVPKRVLVILRKDRIQIKKQVHFATDSDVILPDSGQLLHEIAATILENPRLKLIRVEGHTDSQGDDTHNLGLSDRRARSVVRALIQRGVDPDRLKGVGFGELRPLRPNKTAKDRALNRRVEFMIEGQEPG
ncbi:MAG: carboxypeptidase regulatory-like domain-containing protein [Myxococcaceae bacterium]